MVTNMHGTGGIDLIWIRCDSNILRGSSFEFLGCANFLERNIKNRDTKISPTYKEKALHCC